MGGLGSSCWTADVRDTVEGYPALDVNRLNRAGCLEPGWSGCGLCRQQDGIAQGCGNIPAACPFAL